VFGVTTPTSTIRTDLAPTGALRASINLGNPVLAQGTPAEPAGVTVDIARELAARLAVPLELVCFAAARESFEAMKDGRADVCFLAIEPARQAEVAFTSAYVVVEGVYAVPRGSRIVSAADVDSAEDEVRVGVKQGSAYDLFLSRTLQHATILRGDDGVDIFRELGLDVVAGIRQPLEKYVADQPDLRLIEEPFMQIRQAVGTTKDRSEETVRFLSETVEELKASGFIRSALDRSGQADAAVA
jgi:polar amino acid transport system substrate-binding protein